MILLFTIPTPILVIGAILVATYIYVEYNNLNK